MVLRISVLLVCGMAEGIWSIAVFKCKAEKTREVLVGIYDFAKDLEGLRDLHFIVRDRIEDQVIFSFRFLEEQKVKDVVNSKIAFKLGNLLAEDMFVIDPPADHPLYRYVAWPLKETEEKRGSDKFSLFCSFLSQMSRSVVEMAKNQYFNSAERVELAHVFSWMLGCTEYGLLSPHGMEVGYFDRMEDKYHTFLKQDFQPLKE